MIQFKKSLTALLLLLFVTSTALQAQRELINHSYDKKNKITAKLSPLVGSLPSNGYMPMRLTLKNGTKFEKDWTLDFNSKSKDDYYHGRRNNDHPTLTSKFSYNCPAESTKTYDILVPIVTAMPRSHTDTAAATLSIKLISGGETIGDSMNCYQHMNLPATLLSTKLYVQHSSKFNSLIPAISRGYSSGNEEYAAEFTPSSMSEDWRAYSGFDVIICTDDDWREMSAGAQNAILEWNRLGGEILIYRLNGVSNFKSLKIDDSEENTNKTTIDRSFGSVTIMPLANIKALDVNQTSNLINNPKNKSSKIRSINENYESSSTGSGTWSLQKALGKLSFSPFYLILILIGFGILVGPVNLFVFAKAGRRHRLFITTPIIALGASLLLVLLIIIQDGFGGHGQRVQLIEVRADGGENKAYIWQEQVARTGVILGGSFETSSPTFISPVPVAPSRFSRVTRDNGGGSSNYTAKHGETGLAASGDWFQSRSVHGHYLESVIPTRGRITLKSSQGAPVVNSSFDYEIQELIYIDDSGQTWEASNIAAGDSKKLTPSTPVDALKLIHKHHVTMSVKLQDKLDTLRKRKNHFIAITDEAPAISTLDSIKWTHTESIITGPVVR
ncbi:MAG: hypothetical protein ACI9E1_001776 [Cryomorphaceae bacterium]|jgi:hypothetical protein